MRFKDPILQRCFDAARQAAADNFSEFYYGCGEIGPRWPRRGAGHRDAYWNGRSGIKPRGRYIPQSMAYAFCAAGYQDRLADEKVHPRRELARSVQGAPS